LGSYQAALESFQAADSSDCADALRSAYDAQSLALRARALVRTGRAAEAVDSLTVPSPLFNNAEAGEIHAVRASAQIMLGRNADAESSLVEARALVFSTGIAALEAEVHYLTALLAWQEKHYEETLRHLDVVLALNDGRGPYSAGIAVDKYPLPLAYWRSRAFELRSMSEAINERFLDQASLMTKALETFERGLVRDRYAEAAMLFNAAVLVRDLEVPTLAALVADRAEKFAWCDATRVFEFLVFRVLGTRHALEGDHVSTLRYFRRSADRAPSVPMRLLSILDRYRLMREIGETTTAAEELDYAMRLASQTDWATASVHERAALSLLAQLLAPTDAARARALFNRYTTIALPRSPVALDGHNRRHYADDCYAEAQILRAEGESKRAFCCWSKRMKFGRKSDTSVFARLPRANWPS